MISKNPETDTAAGPGGTETSVYNYVQLGGAFDMLLRKRSCWIITVMEERLVPMQLPCWITDCLTG